MAVIARVFYLAALYHYSASYNFAGKVVYKLKLLFWNCKRNIDLHTIKELLKVEDVDIAFFAETPDGWKSELSNTISEYICGDAIGGCKKIYYIHKSKIEFSQWANSDNNWPSQECNQYSLKGCFC